MERRNKKQEMQGMKSKEQKFRREFQWKLTNPLIKETGQKRLHMKKRIEKFLEEWKIAESHDSEELTMYKS